MMGDIRIRLELLLFCLATCCSYSASDLDVFKTAADAKSTTVLPEFLTADQYQVENVTEGNSILLKCRVINLAMHHTVSWLRVRDVQVLTVGGLVFSSDPRMEVVLEAGKWKTSGSWTLRISPAVPQDSGIYQCQVNTEPASTLDITVNIVPLPTPPPDDAGLFNSSSTESVNAVDFNNSRHTTTAVLQQHPHQIQLQQHHQQDQQLLQQQQQMEQQQTGNLQQQPADDLARRINSSAFVAGPVSESTVSSKRAVQQERIDVEEPNPQRSILNQTSESALLPKQEAETVSKEEEDMDNHLLKPIISLFSVAAVILILGGIRSFCKRPKSDDGSDKASYKARSRTGTAESRKSSRSSKSTGSRGAAAGRNITREDQDQEHQYTEIRKAETPLIEIIEATPPVHGKTQANPFLETDISDVSESSEVRAENLRLPKSERRKKRSYAGINKAGVRRSRERYLASMETLYSVSPLPEEAPHSESVPNPKRDSVSPLSDEAPSLECVGPPTNQQTKQVENPAIEKKRKIYFNPFNDYSDQ